MKGDLLLYWIVDTSLRSCLLFTFGDYEGTLVVLGEWGIYSDRVYYFSTRLFGVSTSSIQVVIFRSIILFHHHVVNWKNQR